MVIAASVDRTVVRVCVCVCIEVLLSACASRALHVRYGTTTSGKLDCKGSSRN